MVVKAEKHTIEELNFIFCTDRYLLKMNKDFLNHDTYTDIITFNTGQDRKKIQGDIFISYDRVKENARQFQASVRDETHRVMIHGVLHLLGYSDKKPADKKTMTQKEDLYLLKRGFLMTI